MASVSAPASEQALSEEKKEAAIEKKEQKSPDFFSLSGQESATFKDEPKPKGAEVREQKQKDDEKPAVKKNRNDEKADPEEEPELSEFEQYVRRQESKEIRQFGYALFSQPPSTFAPAEKIPVSADYVLGPGDEIRISVWGKVEGQWRLTVDRDGNITLPKLGVLNVRGLSFNELKEFLKKEFSLYYTGFDLNVSLGPLRSMTVYVVGGAQKPGAYTVSSLSTLVNAIFAAGGPLKTGSMRDIQLKRNGKTVAHLDLYEFFLKGDKVKDERLKAEDVIFIPPVGPQAAITGSVTNPAIYELKDESTIPELISLAGGLSPLAFKGRVQIERIDGGRRQVVVESSLEDANGAVLKLNAGDLVRIFPVFQDRRVVRVSGAVHGQGEYGYKQGMSLRELVSMAGGLKYYAYTKEAELTRVTVTEKGPETEKFSIDLASALSGASDKDFILQENDFISVKTVPEWELYRVVKISGEVRFPGTYMIEKGERLSSLIKRAGGTTGEAYIEGAIFTRKFVRELQQKQIDEMVDRLEMELLGKGAVDSSTMLTPENAKISEYELNQKKEFIAKLKNIKANGRMVIRLDGPNGAGSDITLEDGDSLHVPRTPNSVQVIGSVYNQTAFIFDRGTYISDYIDMAGGYTENADTGRVYVLKADGRAFKPGGGAFWSRGTGLDPGDTVIVPDRLDKTAWMREIKDISQIFYQIAVSAGVLLVAF